MPAYDEMNLYFRLSPPSTMPSNTLARLSPPHLYRRWNAKHAA
jgi:hypothetical protein